MAAIETVNEIVDFYTNLLIIQYNQKPKARATIAAMVREMIANGVLFDIQDGFNLETATGTQLDILGKYIGIDRFYLDNEFNGAYFGFADATNIPNIEVGPFSLKETELGNSWKWTAPVNAENELSDDTDALEVLASTYPGYNPLKPKLEYYSHPLYFIRNDDYFDFKSSIYGAYTSSNVDGPARSELRKNKNSTGRMSGEFEFTVPHGWMANNAKAQIGQIHRIFTANNSPIFKLNFFCKIINVGTAQAGGPSTIQLATGASSTTGAYSSPTQMGVYIVSGTGAGQVRHFTAYDGPTRTGTVDSPWDIEPDNTSVYEVGNSSYRGLVKAVDGGPDINFDFGGGLPNQTLLNGIVSGQRIKLKYDYDPGPQTLIFTVNDVVKNTVPGVVLGGAAYDKLGFYANAQGDGTIYDIMGCRIFSYEELY